jgi:RimJ/RimL family protein N-acetyltransferase
LCRISKKMEIKIAQPSDWQKYKEIRLKSLKESPQAFGGSFDNESQQSDDEWREKIIKSNRFFVLAEEEGIVAGVAGAKQIDADNGIIIAVYLVPEARGKGYSKEILSIVLQELENRKAKIVTLTVNTKQEAAVRAYKALGFQIIKTNVDEKLGDGLLHDEYVMEKVL